jgi:hypothetical protein
MVKIQHFEEAMDNILPSVSEKDNLKYEKLRKNLRRSKSILSKQENDKN